MRINGRMGKRDTTTSTRTGAKANPASSALAEIEASLRDMPEVGTIFRKRGSDTLHLDHIHADPMNEGHGSRAMVVICDICDRHGVTLTGHIVHDGDDDPGYEDDPYDDGENEFDDDRPLSPSSHDLERWYARFGFEIARLDWKSAIRRPPLAMLIDVPRDAETASPEASGPRF